MSQHKAEIAPLPQTSAEDWQVFFDDRADIVEFDGGLPLNEAKAEAFACCIVEWLNGNPAHWRYEQHLGCGDCEHGHDPLLPYSVEPSGQAGLHSLCWPAWYDARKAEAAAALAATQQQSLQLPVEWQESCPPQKPICLPTANEG